MNKRKILTIVAIAITITVLIAYLTVLALILTDPGRFKQVIRNSVKEQVATIPIPKDGKSVTQEQISQAVSDYIATNPPIKGSDGQNATDAQVSKAVSDYLTAHPIKIPKNGRTPVKGKDYHDGATPLFRCNVLANRWEIRLNATQNWQLLNGESVKCTILGESE
jgi:hypothetical protein